MNYWVVSRHINGWSGLRACVPTYALVAHTGGESSSRSDCRLTTPTTQPLPRSRNGLVPSHCRPTTLICAQKS